ncbi:MAG: PucR family transcriptional regulator [Gordonia sp. (in: high G+C Gram-positive bacteria)]
MATSVRWLLAQRRLELTLRAGDAGMARTLDCAVSSELITAADWMSGGEVLLTTGLRLPDDPAGRRAYVDSLNDVGVAALGFGVGLGFADIPPEMCRAADAVGLPLFEVPLHIPFSAITRAVLEQIGADRSARLLAATRAQPRMTRAAVAGGSPAVVRELADAIRRRVVLLDAAHGEVASSPDALGPADVERVRTLVGRDPASAGAAFVADDVTITIARIGSATRTFGFLGVLGDALDDAARMLIGHAVSLLALEHAKPLEVRREAAGLQRDVLAVALDGVIGPRSLRILRRAADAQGRIRAVVFTFADVRGAGRGAARLIDELERSWRPVFVHVDDTEVIALLRGDDHTDFAGTLLNVLSGGLAVGGGIGPPVNLSDGEIPCPTAVADTVGKARLACRSAVVGQLVDLEGARSLLALEPVRRALGDSHDHRLAPLLDHDRNNGTCLRDSLLAFLEANGNWGAAAATLGVHRHTLRSRIERVEDMLAADLNDARTRAELLLMILGASA